MKTEESPEAMREYVENLRREINARLNSLILGLAHFKLYPQMQYALMSRGKRLRPILTALSGQSVGGDLERLYPLALAVELIHTASLIHDDVVDEDKQRRASPTLYRRWKNKAILAGDIFYALACNIITTYGDAIWQVISEGAIELCDGQFMDVSLTIGNCTEKDYFTKISKKSASMFQVSARAGAIVGEGSEGEVARLSAFGRYFGIAYQLKDDLMELYDGGEVPPDLKNGRVTLPYLHLYLHGDGEAKELLLQNFGNRKASGEAAQELRLRMDKCGSLAYTKQRIAEYMARACRELEALRDTRYKRLLIQLTRDVLTVP